MWKCKLGRNAWSQKGNSNELWLLQGHDSWGIMISVHFFMNLWLFYFVLLGFNHSSKYGVWIKNHKTVYHLNNAMNIVHSYLVNRSHSDTILKNLRSLKFFYYWLPELLFLFSDLFVHTWLQNLGCKFINLRWNVPYRLHCKHLPHYIFWECKILWYWSQGKWTEII